MVLVRDVEDGAQGVDDGVGCTELALVASGQQVGGEAVWVVLVAYRRRTWVGGGEGEEASGGERTAWWRGDDGENAAGGDVANKSAVEGGVGDVVSPAAVLLAVVGAAVEVAAGGAVEGEVGGEAVGAMVWAGEDVGDVG